MDLFGLNRVSSLGGKLYGLVILDDYSRYTWVHFIFSKSDTFEVFESFITRIQNEFDSKVEIIYAIPTMVVSLRMTDLKNYAIP